MADGYSQWPEWPAIFTSWFAARRAGSAAALGGWTARLRQLAGGAPASVVWLSLAAFVLALVVTAVVAARVLPTLATPGNMAAVVARGRGAYAAYGAGAAARQPLSAYLAAQTAAGVPDNQLLLANFYVCAFRNAWRFPSAVGGASSTNGVVSTDALSLVLRGGARCIELPVWPDASPGGGWRPIVTAMAPGSAWKQVTLNSVPLAAMLATVAADGMGAALGDAGGAAVMPARTDPLLLYLNFQGTPRAATFAAVAAALAAHLEPYRLPFPWYRRALEATLPVTPVAQLAGAVVVLSNVGGDGTPFAEWVNAVPGVYSPTDAAAAGAAGNSATLARIQQTVTLLEPSADGNVDATTGWGVGIQAVLQDPWVTDANLTAYMDPTTGFGACAWRLKPL
jgi:hypothetical protein